MTTNKDIAKLIREISGQENIISMQKLYVRFLGNDHITAIVLSQIVFYSDKSKRQDGYFYKSYTEWEEEVLLSKRQVSYSADKLRDMGILETKVMRANGKPTVHYKLLFDKFIDSLMTFCHLLDSDKQQNVTFLESNKMSLSITEVTTSLKDSTTTTNAGEEENEIQEPEKPKPIAKPKPILQFVEEELMIRLSPMQMEKLLSYQDDLIEGYDIIQYATILAADKNKRNFAFVEYLIKDWLMNKAETLERVKAYEKEKFAKTNPAAKQKKAVNDWDSLK